MELHASGVLGVTANTTVAVSSSLPSNGDTARLTLSVSDDGDSTTFNVALEWSNDGSTWDDAGVTPIAVGAAGHFYLDCPIAGTQCRIAVTGYSGTGAVATVDRWAILA